MRLIHENAVQGGDSVDACCWRSQGWWFTAAWLREGGCDAALRMPAERIAHKGLYLSHGGKAVARPEGMKAMAKR